MAGRDLQLAFRSTQGLIWRTPQGHAGPAEELAVGPVFPLGERRRHDRSVRARSARQPDLLPFEKPFVAAHEWAHLAGYADESEASFVGWLTCVRAAPRRSTAPRCFSTGK
jgi:hypothetical protein